MLESIKEEIKETEELLQEKYEDYCMGRLSLENYEYFKKVIIADTYDMIKRILEKEGNK